MKVDIKGAIVANDDKWIYDWSGLEAVCPKEVLGKLETANGERLDVYINSGGGDIFAGSEIYAALQEYGGEVYVHVVGAACSSASIIACAGHSDIVRTGLYMYHNVSGSARGDYHVMDKSSEILQAANRAVAAAYVEKTGMDESELLARMDAETWLTAAQAVELGFIDEIAESNNLNLTAAAVGALPSQTIDRLRGLIKPQAENDRSVLMAQARLKLLTLKTEVKE